MKKKDYTEALQSELRRLNVSLVSRIVEFGNRRTIEFSDKQVVSFLRNVGNDDPNGCWTWNSTRIRGGYGKFRTSKARAGMAEGASLLAHRVAYLLLRGPIATGLTLDHTCRNRVCVNPDHLDPCTSAVNSRRSPFVLSSINRSKTTCPEGHPYDGVYRSPTGDRRLCKTCMRRNARNYQARRRSERASRERLTPTGQPKPVQPFQVTSHSPWKWEEVPLWPAE